VLRKKLYDLRLDVSLPSPPAIGLRILAVSREGGEREEAFTRLALADAALAARVLQMANTERPDDSDQIATVEGGVELLGAAQIEDLCMDFDLVGGSGERCLEFDYEGYWSNALATAISLQALIEDAIERGLECRLTPEVGWTLGLTIGVGRLAMASVHPDRYDSVLSMATHTPTASLLDYEREAFGITHLEVSAGLLEEWGVPALLPEAIMQHQARLFGGMVEEEIFEAQLLTAACELSRALVRGGPDVETSWRAGFPAVDRAAFELSVDAQQVVSIAADLRRKWSEWSLLLRAPENTGPVELCIEETRIFPLEEAEGLSTPTRVLLVDDDHRVLRIMEHALSREGYEVYTAESCEAALRMSLELLPHVLITDWMMPGMSGVELCHTLRRTEVGRRMYVLFVTAREDDSQALRAFRAGVDDYIVKPFNPRILAARVRAGQRLIQMRERVVESERERLRQLAEMGVMTRKMREASLTDALTQLPNRRHAMDRLKQEWELAVREGHDLSVLMLDLDHFKRVNDGFGHDAGDFVLRHTADVMRATSRGGEVLCRMGGEEFISIHPGYSLGKVMAFAERLCEAVANTTFDYPGFSGQVTASIGVALKGPGMANIDHLLKAADDALYRAKKNGRNQVSGPEEGRRRSA